MVVVRTWPGCGPMLERGSLTMSTSEIAKFLAEAPARQEEADRDSSRTWR